MAVESSYPAITDLTGAELLTAITTPGVAGGTKTISASDVANSTVMTERIRDVVGTTLVAGSGTSIVVDDAGNTVTITAGAGATYTDSNARSAIAAALLGETGYIDVTPNLGANAINLAIDPALKSRVAALEQKSLVQSNDNVTAGGAVYASLPGSAGSYISTPNASALNVAADIEITMRVAMTDWTPTSVSQTLFSKWGASTANASFRLNLNTAGTLGFAISTDGVAFSTGTTTSAPTVADGAAIWLRVTRVSSTGNVNFYYAPDQTSEPTSWTTITLNRGTTAGALFASTADVEVGANNAGTTNPANGKVYRVIMRAGIAGTVVADMNAADWTSGSTWTGPAGNVWTLNGSAAIVAGAGGGISNTNTEFVLTQIDAHPTIAVAQHDTMMFFSSFAFVNTSASSATFTPKVTMNGVDLFTFPAITVAAASGASRSGTLALRVVMNAADGSGQVASVELALGNAVTGNTDLGGIMAATDQIRLTGNRVLSAVTTFTSVPLFEVRLTMSIANASIAARRLSSQLYLAKA